MGREISEGIEGAVTGDRVNCVSHMLYADDLGLTTNDPGKMQTKSVSPLQNPFTYDGVVLPEKDRFEYLGMLLDRR